MNKKTLYIIFGLIVVALIIVAIVCCLSYYKQPQVLPDIVDSGDSSSLSSSSIPSTAYECNADAKICPDGSAVGRTGQKCEFAACPPSTATSATLRTTVGQKVTGLQVTITPLAVTEDSRCPANANCIWAGTVKVKTKIQSGMGTSEMVLELGKEVTTEAETITLTEVTPTKTQEAIPSPSYRFVFEVRKK